MSNTIGRRSTRERRVRLEDRDRVADRAGRDPDAGQPADGAERRARRSAGRARSRSGRASVSTPTTRGRRRRRLGPEARERRPLAQLDARRLHRERVGADVARRVDVAVGLEVAAAAMAVRARASG